MDCAFAFVTCDAHLQSISCHMFFARTDQDVRELTSNVSLNIVFSPVFSFLFSFQCVLGIHRIIHFMIFNTQTSFHETT